MAKDVFCGLADVGRVRYRVLLAEWEAGRKPGADGSVAPMARPVKAKGRVMDAAAVAPAKAKAFADRATAMCCAELSNTL